MLVFLQAPKRYQNGGTYRVHSDSHKKFKCTLYFDRLVLMRWYTDGPESALDEALGE